MLHDIMVQKVSCDHPDCKNTDWAFVDCIATLDCSDVPILEIDIEKLPMGWIQFDHTYRVTMFNSGKSSYRKRPMTVKSHFCSVHAGADKKVLDKQSKRCWVVT